MGYNSSAEPGGDVSTARRLTALLIDAAICFVAVHLLARPWFSGLPAILLVLGAYKFASDVFFGRSLGQALTGLYVVLDQSRRRPPLWWLIREARLWLFPGFFLLTEVPVAHSSLSNGVGIILLVALPLMLTEAGLLVADVVHALGSEDGRSLSDLLSHTSVRSRPRRSVRRASMKAVR